MSDSGFNLYNAIIKPLRDADITQLLKRFLTGPQIIRDQAEAEILSLRDQVKPDRVRADLLQYLLPLVGFTSELRSITDRLTESQLRRLALVAVPLWNQRHTTAGLINAVRLLTGHNAVMSDWFRFRSILGESSLTDDQLSSGGDFWIIGGDISRYDEYWSNIRVMDDGTLDELLLIDVCRLMRPLDERFEVFISDFIDQFDAKFIDKWTNTDGGSITANGVIDTVSFPKTLKLLANSSLTPIVPIINNQANNHDYNIACKFNLPVSGSLVVRWYTASTSSGTGYELSISATTGLGTFSRWVSGVQTTLQPSGSWPLSCAIIPGVWYSLRISTSNLDSNTRSIRILVDGNQAVPNSGPELIDTGAQPSSGFYLFKNPSGAVPAWIDNVESWRNPARFATIGIGTPVDRGGVVTMTSNFAQ